MATSPKASGHVQTVTIMPAFPHGHRFVDGHATRPAIPPRNYGRAPAFKFQTANHKSAIANHRCGYRPYSLAVSSMARTLSAGTLGWMLCT